MGEKILDLRLLKDIHHALRARIENETPPTKNE